MTYRMLFFRVSILTVIVALFLAFGFEQYWLGSVAALGLGWGGWFGLKKARNAWSADLFLAGVVLLVTIGALLDLITNYLLVAILGALGAWDLIRFQKRIAHSPRSEDILQIEKQHLGFLGLTILIGGSLAVVIGIVRMQIGFGVTLISGVILIIILSEIIRQLKN
jgi:hypothetical protein